MMIRADSPRYKWILVAVLFLAASLNYADRGALTAVFPLLRKDLGMSDLALAAIGSFFLWSYALFSPLAGYLGDRFSRSALVTWSVVAWSVVTALTAFVKTSEQLLTMRVLLGVAESLYIPASLALIAEHHATPTRAMAMSLHLAGFYAGVVFGGTVAGYLGDSYGWRPALLLLGGVGLILGLLCKFTVFAAPRSPSAEPTSEKQPPLPFVQSLSNLVKTASYWVLLVEAMLLAIGTWIFANWLPLYFTETFKMSLSGAGFAGTFPVQAGAMIGILAGGYFSDRVARKTVQSANAVPQPLLPGRGSIVAGLRSFQQLCRYPISGLWIFTVSCCGRSERKPTALRSAAQDQLVHCGRTDEHHQLPGGRDRNIHRWLSQTGFRIGRNLCRNRWHRSGCRNSAVAGLLSCSCGEISREASISPVQHQ